jgi:hypothetical protein
MKWQVDKITQHLGSVLLISPLHVAFYIAFFALESQWYSHGKIVRASAPFLQTVSSILYFYTKINLLCYGSFTHKILVAH